MNMDIIKFGGVFRIFYFAAVVVGVVAQGMTVLDFHDDEQKCCNGILP